MSPEPSQDFLPVDITFTTFKRGEAPVVTKERRHMVFNLWSYRLLAKEAGIDLEKMGRESRKLRAAQEADVKKYGVEGARRRMLSKMQATGVGLLPGNDGDDLQQMALIVWGALISEDSSFYEDEKPRLTVNEIAKALRTGEAQTELFSAALSALMLYLYNRPLDAGQKEDIARTVASLQSEGPDTAEAGDAEAGDGPDPTDEGK